MGARLSGPNRPIAAAARAFAVGACCALIAGLIAAVPGPAAQAAAGAKLVSGWFGWWASPAQAEAVAASGAGVTEDSMIFMWAFNGAADPACLMDPDNRGACRSGSTGPNFTAIRDSLRARGITVYATHTDLSSSRAGQLSAYLATASNRAALAELLAAKAVAAGVDGVDLDWENFAFRDDRSGWPQTRARFVDFVARADAALGRVGKKLSVTVPAGFSPFVSGQPNDSGGYWVYDWAGIIGSVDRLRLMAYDYSVTREGPVGPNAWAEEVVRSAMAQVGAANSRKISIGVHQYGRDWVRLNSAGGYLAAPGCPAGWRPDAPTTSRSLAAVRQIAAAKRATPVWHPTHAEWYLDYSESVPGSYDRAGVAVPAACTAARRIWFGDQRTAQERLKLAGRYSLAGISAWNFGGVEADFFSGGLAALARAIARDTRQPAGIPLSVPVAGTAGVPAQASAVAVNLTVADPAAAGSLVAYPCGQDPPATPVANFALGQTVAAATIVKVGDGGRICLRTSALARLVVDVSGYLPQASGFAPSAVRLLDTRGGQAPGRGSVTRVAVPGTAPSAALTVTVSGADAAGHVTVYPCGTARPLTSAVNVERGATATNLHVGAVGTGREICLWMPISAHLVVDLVGTLPAGSELAPRAQARLLDTRTGAAVPAGGTVRVPVPGAAAAVVNITATAATAQGDLVAYPCGRPVPAGSNLNFVPGRTVGNTAFVETGDGDSICLRSRAATHLLVDLEATAPDRPDVRALAPKRLLDTRRTSSPIRAGAVLPITVPDPGTAAEVTVTATSPATAGYLTAFPCGQPVPRTSTVNFTAGATVANSAIAGIGTGNRICVYSAATTHLVVDYTGYVPRGSAIAAGAPRRLLDTRTGGGLLQPGGSRTITVPPGAAGAVLNLTAVAAAGTGHLAVGRCGTAVPTSALNFARGQTVANMVIAGPAADGRLCITASAPTHVVADLTATVAEGADLRVQPGRRLLDTRSGARPAALAVREIAVPDDSLASALNVTVVAPANQGYLQIWPCGAPAPATSAANFRAGQTVAAGLVVQTGRDRKVCVRATTSAHLVVDYGGFVRPRTFDPLPAVRLADTRR